MKEAITTYCRMICKRSGLWMLMACLASGYALGGTTTKYTYDVLGRLTFVSDPADSTRNRDYDYDKAGNRLLVSASTANDAAAEPGAGGGGAPAAPTGLSSLQSSSCSWQANWSAVSGAASYVFRDVSGLHQLTVTTNTVTYAFSSCSIDPNTEKPKWVQACNSSGACSAKSDFP